MKPSARSLLSLALAASLAGCATTGTAPLERKTPREATRPYGSMKPIPNPGIEKQPAPTPDARRAAPTVPPPRRAATPPNPDKSAPRPNAPSPADRQRAAQLRASGLEQLNRGDIDRAVALLRQAQQADPGNALIQRDLDRALRVSHAVRARP